MKFKTHFLHNYLKYAPLSLALERTMECKILAKQKFERPILDLGCGEGLFAYILFDEKIDVGIDPDSRELNRAKDFDMYRELICCYGNSIPKDNKSFHTIFSNSVLEHIKDIELVLMEANRLLSDKGNFYVTLPTNLFDQYNIINQTLSFLGLKILANKYRIFFNRFWKHYHFYNDADWKKLFERNGFTISASFRYSSKAACLTNDFLIPFSFFSFISKKLVNRWALLPGLRSIAMIPLARALDINKENVKCNNGGLIFFHLKKANC